MNNDLNYIEELQLVYSYVAIGNLWQDILKFVILV